MKKLDPTMAQQVAQAVATFQQRRTGFAPKAVTVVLSDDTLVVTLHEALSPAEKAMARTPEGAVHVQEFHRQLFQDSADLLRQEIQRITGVAVGEVAAEIEPTTGAVVHAFTTGTMVQVFQLAERIPVEAWNGSNLGNQPQDTEGLPCQFCQGPVSHLMTRHPFAVWIKREMSIFIEIVKYIVIDLPGKVWLMTIEFLENWWYSHYR